jgi:hypothetical protein
MELRKESKKWENSSINMQIQLYVLIFSIFSIINKLKTNNKIQIVNNLHDISASENSIFVCF